jgi:hypothetical protein
MGTGVSSDLKIRLKGVVHLEAAFVLDPVLIDTWRYEVLAAVPAGDSAGTEANNNPPVFSATNPDYWRDMAASIFIF